MLNEEKSWELKKLVVTIRKIIAIDDGTDKQSNDGGYVGPINLFSVFAMPSGKGAALNSFHCINMIRKDTILGSLVVGRCRWFF